MSFPPSDNDWLHDPLVPDAFKRALQRRYLYNPTPIESPLRFTQNRDKGDENVEKQREDPEIRRIVDETIRKLNARQKKLERLVAAWRELDSALRDME